VKKAKGKKREENVLPLQEEKGRGRTFSS